MWGKDFFYDKKYKFGVEKFLGNSVIDRKFKLDRLQFYNSLACYYDFNAYNYIEEEKSFNYEKITKKLRKLLGKIYIVGRVGFDDFYELKEFDKIAKELSINIKKIIEKI